MERSFYIIRPDHLAYGTTDFLVLFGGCLFCGTPHCRFVLLRRIQTGIDHGGAQAVGKMVGIILGINTRIFTLLPNAGADGGDVGVSFVRMDVGCDLSTPTLSVAIKRQFSTTPRRNMNKGLKTTFVAIGIGGICAACWIYMQPMKLNITLFYLTRSFLLETLVLIGVLTVFGGRLQNPQLPEGGMVRWPSTKKVLVYVAVTWAVILIPPLLPNLLLQIPVEDSCHSGFFWVRFFYFPFWVCNRFIPGLYAYSPAGYQTVLATGCFLTMVLFYFFALAVAAWKTPPWMTGQTMQVDGDASANDWKASCQHKLSWKLMVCVGLVIFAWGSLPILTTILSERVKWIMTDGMSGGMGMAKLGRMAAWLCAAVLLFTWPVARGFYAIGKRLALTRSMGTYPVYKRLVKFCIMAWFLQQVLAWLLDKFLRGAKPGWIASLFEVFELHNGMPFLLLLLKLASFTISAGVALVWVLEKPKNILWFIKSCRRARSEKDI